MLRRRIEKILCCICQPLQLRALPAPPFGWGPGGFVQSDPYSPLGLNKVIMRYAHLWTTQRYLGKVTDVEAMWWIEDR